MEISDELNDLSGRVIGSAIEVHQNLGPGLLESLYEESLAAEFQIRNIPFEKQKMVPVFYKNKPIGEHRLDFLVDNQLIVELKAVESLLPLYKFQVITYLKITNLHLGLLINFNSQILASSIRRIIL